MKTTRPILWRAIVAFFLVFAMPAQTVAQEQKAPAQPPSVSVVPVVRSEVTLRIVASGGLLAREEVAVSARVSGAEIIALMADVGDTVVKGEQLARLSEQTLTAQLQQADANLASAGASIAQANGQLASATATATQARTALDRQQQLRLDGTVAQATLDQAQAVADSAAAAVQTANAAISSAQAGKSQAMAARAIAALNLSWATVTAPVGGIVIARTARLGDQSNAGSAMFELIRDGQIEAEVQIVETDIVNISVGNVAMVSIAGLPPRRGTVRRISPKVDALTRLGSARISIDDLSGLRVGVFARADITASRRMALTVPTSAVTTIGEHSVVQVVTDGIVQERTIVPGVLSMGRREVISGLEEGQQVLARAGPFFRSGDAVTPVVTGDPPEAPAEMQP